eukprot:m.1348459 g.1348459  ORF g.1348459 m.1348459 type:complete len:71 (-) comp24914_c0_seq31:25-237(-)
MVGVVGRLSVIGRTSTDISSANRVKGESDALARAELVSMVAVVISRAPCVFVRAPLRGSGDVLVTDALAL